jgi:hypothetical protein
LWVSFADGDEDTDEDDVEVLAPKTPPDVIKTYCRTNVPCSAVVVGVAGNGAPPLAAMPWPPSWASAADNIDKDNKEELVPQTPPATKTFNTADVVMVDGMEADCVAGERDGWQEVLPRRCLHRPAPLAPTFASPCPYLAQG